MFSILTYNLSIFFLIFNQETNKLNAEQEFSIFHRTQIPKYKLVYIKTTAYRAKRELRPVEFEIEGKKTQLSLTLIKFDVMSPDIPIWTVETNETNPHSRKYQRLSPEQTHFDGTYFEDIEKMGLLLGYFKDDNIYYDGVYGESSQTKVVRSMREKWWTRRGKQPNHLLYDVEPDVANTKPIQVNDTHPFRLMDQPIDVMYPKLLIVLEYNHFKRLGGNVREAVKYVSTFWNAVNLKYSKLTKPEVKIIVSGIIIEKNEHALSYISESRDKEYPSQLNCSEMVIKGADYFKEEFHGEVDFKNYDSVITMAYLDSGTTSGIAFQGRICSDSWNSAYIRDDGSYSGIHIAAHELGHLLSLPHDGERDTMSCQVDPSNGVTTIMAPYKASVNKFIWSDCSKNSLKKFAWQKHAECLRNSNRYRIIKQTKEQNLTFDVVLKVEVSESDSD